MLRLLHLADLHLGYKPPNDSVASAADHYRDRLLEYIADFLAGMAQRPDLLLIAGDLFDSHLPEPDLIRRVIFAIKRIQDLGMAVITVPGNHDELTYSDSVYRRYEREWPGFLVTSTELEAPMPLVVRGNRIYLVSMAYDGSVATAKGKIHHFPARAAEALHLCLLHGSLDKSIAEDAGTRCLILDQEALLASGYDYIALGHEHRPRILRESQSDATLLAYPGMIAARDFNDPACKQLLFVNLERGTAPQVEWVPFTPENSLKSITLDCSALPDLPALRQRLRQEAEAQHTVRVALHGELSFPLSPARLAAEIQPESGRLLLDSRGLRFSRDTLHRLAADHSLEAALARRCLQELGSTTDPDRERLLHQALLKGLDSLAEREVMAP